MKRRLLNLLTAGSLLLLLAVCVMWWRSYRIIEGLIVTPPHNDYVYSVSSRRVGLHGVALIASLESPLYRRPDVKAYRRRWSFRHYEEPAPPTSSNESLTGWAERRSFLGLAYGHDNDPTPMQYLVVVPYWMLATGLALLPGAWIASYRKRRRRVGLGLCRSCGYDLRATPDRCPECGAAAGREQTIRSSAPSA